MQTNQARFATPPLAPRARRDVGGLPPALFVGLCLLAALCAGVASLSPWLLNAAAASQAPAAEPQQAVNFVVFLADDPGEGDLGRYGHPVVQTSPVSSAYRGDLNQLRTLLDNWRVETADHMPAERRPDGWTRDGVPLPNNQPWYDDYIKAGRSNF
jgi:hypothetical protein